jgi:hypothetical protein
MDPLDVRAWLNAESVSRNIVGVNSDAFVTLEKNEKNQKKDKKEERAELLRHIKRTGAHEYANQLFRDHADALARAAGASTVS